MAATSDKARLKREFRRLLQSMDFVSRHPALARSGRSREAQMLAQVYQELGLVWEFLGLQCRHWDGWRKASRGKRVCRICGLVKGIDEPWFLLPREGKKTIGYKATPTSMETFTNKRAASVVHDTIDFYGARVNVDVHNSYRSRLFRSKNISMAAERIVRVEEGGMECWLDTHLICFRFEKREPGSEPPFSAFLSELPRKALKRFPVMLDYDRRGRFVGLSIFRPQERLGGRTKMARPRRPTRIQQGCAVNVRRSAESQLV